MNIKIYVEGGCLLDLIIDGERPEYTLIDYDIMKEMGFDEDQEDEYLEYVKELQNNVTS